MKAVAIVAAALAMAGCEPCVMVYGRSGAVTHTVRMGDACGEAVSVVKEETPSNYVVTVTYEKRKDVK